MVQATINRIRRPSRKTSRKPSQLEPRSSDGAPIEKGMRRIEAESAADARNEAEFMAKAAPIPTKAKMAPPSAGPTSRGSQASHRSADAESASVAASAEPIDGALWRAIRADAC